MGKKRERLSNIQGQKSFQNRNSPHQLLPLVKSSSQDFYTWNLTPACLVNYGNPTWKPLFPCVNLFARCCPPTALLFSSWQALPEGPEERGIHREPSHRSRRCQLEEARLVPIPLGLHFFKDKWLARLNITQGLCREEFPGLEGLLGALQADSAHGFLLWGLWRGLEAHRCCLKSQAEFASRAQTFFIASYLLWVPPSQGWKTVSCRRFEETCEHRRGAGLQAEEEGKQLNQGVVTANAELQPSHCTEA